MRTYTTLLALLVVAAAAPSGTYTGSKSILGVTVNGSIKIDDDTHFDLGITGAATINCPSEEYALSGSDISLPNAQTSGDCVHDQLASNKVTLESLSYDSGADSITVNVKKSIAKISLTLTKGGLANSAAVNPDPPVGTFCGSIPLIIKENITVRADQTFDYYNDVSVAKVHVGCTGEKYAWDGSGSMDISAALADPNDCLTKSTASDKKSVPTFNWDGKIISSKNGYGTLKMKPC